MTEQVKTKSNNKSFLPVGRAESNTARKFRTPFPLDALPQAVCVNVDWLALMVECHLNEPKKDEKPIFVNEFAVLEPLGKGTPVFNHSWRVYLHGEPVAMIHTHSKNHKIIKPDTAKLEILNHVLYSTEVKETLSDVMQACKCPVIKNISRIDISIDGCTHVYKFLNNYLKQKPLQSESENWNDACRVRRKGNAMFHARMFNQNTNMFESFKIGSSRKNIVVYNKTQEINQVSNKQYIRECWERGGLDTTQDVWRVELRTGSEAIKDIKDGFNLNMLQNPMYLLSWFRSHTNNFFEFVDMKDANTVTDAVHLDLFQFAKLRIPLLSRIPRVMVAGAYKAKMAIHNAYKDVCHHVYRTKESINSAIQHLSDNLKTYNLWEWYEKKKEQWNELYYNRVFYQQAGTLNPQYLLP